MVHQKNYTAPLGPAYYIAKAIQLGFAHSSNCAVDKRSCFLITGIRWASGRGMAKVLAFVGQTGTIFGHAPSGAPAGYDPWRMRGRPAALIDP